MNEIDPPGLGKRSMKMKIKMHLMLKIFQIKRLSLHLTVILGTTCNQSLNTQTSKTAK